MQLTDEENKEILRVTANCMKALKKSSRPQGYNFGANLGRVAGAGIEDHVHFHLVPRWNGDTNFMPVLAEVKMISEDMKETWWKLRKNLGVGRKK